MEETPLCPFGDVLVKARKDRDIMQYRLAKLTKRSARYISMLEHNAGVSSNCRPGSCLRGLCVWMLGTGPATLTHSCRKDGDPG